MCFFGELQYIFFFGLNILYLTYSVPNKLHYID